MSNLSMRSLISWCVTEQECRAVTCEVDESQLKECYAWPWLSGDTVGISSEDLTMSTNHFTYNISCYYENNKSKYPSILILFQRQVFMVIKYVKFLDKLFNFTVNFVDKPQILP